MSHPLYASLVRILHPDGIPAGLGCLVGERYILTSATAIRQALSCNPEHPAAAVRVDFPFIALGQALEVHTPLWMPGPAHPEDLAGLELTQAPPEGAQPAHLTVHEHQWGWACQAPVGAAQAEARPEAWRSSVLLGRDAHGRLSLEAAAPEQPVFAGAPVWSEARQGVVGMLLGANLVLPIQRVLSLWPELFGSPLATLSAAAPTTRLEFRLPAGFNEADWPDQLGALAEAAETPLETLQMLNLDLEHKLIAVQLPTPAAVLAYTRYRSGNPAMQAWAGLGLRIVHSTPAELLAESQAKSAYLASLTHDLRSPLNAILGFSRVIIKGIDGPTTEFQVQDLTAISNSGQQMLEMINELTDMAKSEVGRLALMPEAFNFHKLLNDVATACTAKANEKKQVVTLEIGEAEAFQLTADPKRLKPLLVSLVQAAIYYTPPGRPDALRPVLVKAERLPNAIHVQVFDAGPVVPPEQLDALFIPHNDTEGLPRRVGGTGMGLPLGRRIMAMHGGRLWVESPGPDDQGAVYHLEVPVS